MKQAHFKSLSLRPEVQNIIEQLHFKQPTNIQEKAIPEILQGRSVVGQSKTGSGKTHAYLLPIFQRLKEENNHVQFVITAPTRELCQQIYSNVREIITLAEKENQWFAELLIGGSEKQLTEKKRQTPHIIIGTPHRILDLVNDGFLSIYTAEMFVIDEADLMLDLGFIEEIDQLLVRSKENIQVLAFSATIPERLHHFFKKYLRQPKYIIDDEHIFPEHLEHRLIALKYREPLEIIVELSKVFQPYLALVFTNGKEEADELSFGLQREGLNVGYIHGGLTPRERRRLLREINNLRYQYIVATDLASRGIDIEGVSHVINAQMPKEEHFYIHRVGRTARAGLPGTAISFYDEDDLPLIHSFERKNVHFKYVDVKDGEWIEARRIDDRNQRRRGSRRHKRK
ncbi:MAG TPA: DEAD/DEAH box helicase [Bacillota bacterium]|nr:DEAD/DEAH box helicase [Bacillota bacterium]